LTWLTHFGIINAENISAESLPLGTVLLRRIALQYSLPAWRFHLGHETLPGRRGRIRLVTVNGFSKAIFHKGILPSGFVKGIIPEMFTPKPIQEAPQSERLEAFNDATRRFDEATERWNNRFRMQRDSFVKHYVDGRLSFVLEFKTGRKSGRRNLSATSSDQHTFENLLPIILYLHRKPSDFKDGKQEHVLVPDVQLVKGPDEIPIPSLVGLQVGHYEIVQTGAAFYFSTAKSGYYSLKGVPDWEFSVIANGSGDSETKKLVPSEVKSCSEIVDGVSDNGSKLKAEFLLRSVIEDKLPGLNISILDESIKVGIDKGRDAAFNLRDVMFGPFNF
jgi:hypothetical protein